ncbi:MAG: HNH endonuclease [Alphaproteobacteria bacterium]|nr:HNH endonuclease [Alphaproteobacteria bacterium]
MTTEEAMQEIARRSPRSTVLALAQDAMAAPEQRTVQRTEFARNPYVVAAAIHRANNACEMPGCTATLFARVDGRSYLEVHHVVPLSEKGLDRLDNVAALCPHCHRPQHHGKDRIALRGQQQKHIRSLGINRPAKQ